MDKTLQERCVANFTDQLDIFQYPSPVLCPSVTELNSMDVVSVTTLDDMDYLCLPSEQKISSQAGEVLCGIIDFKGDEYTLWGSTYVILSFASLLSWDQLIKGRICSIRKEFASSDLFCQSSIV